MASGMVVYNSNGNIQVDTNLPTYFLIKSGSLPVAGVVVTAIHPICVIRGSLTAIRSQVNNNNGTWSITFWGASGASGYYYIYDKANPIIDGNFGLSLYNGAGVITYSSSQYPMAIAASGEIPDANVNFTSTPSLTISGLNTSRQYGAFFYNTRSSINRELIFPPNNFRYYISNDVVDTSVAGQVTINFIQVAVLTTPLAQMRPRGGFATVVDVTNIPTNFSI